MIVYCSIGYRSERIGEQVQNLGYKNVFNLKGGIFEWVNKGKTVMTEGQITTKIHPYDKEWGVWLQKGEKVYQ